MMFSAFPLAMRVAITAVLIGSACAWSTPVSAGGDWNDAGIGWKTYDDGLKHAKKTNKPICLVFYTEWCPHCTNYSKVFHDPKVVERSKQFVMVRVDNDKNKDVSKKYAPDGAYIPRTFFLSPTGELAADVHETRDQFKYFYSESSPTGILGGMERALAKLQAAPASKDTKKSN
jgi:thiol:disulfide interchange protein